TGNSDAFFFIFDPSVKHLFAHTDDGTKIATTGDRNIKICDAISGKELLNISTPDLINYAINFSPDGRMIASNACLCVPPGKGFYVNMNHLVIWDTVTGRQLLKINPQDVSIMRTLFLKDNRTLITSGITGHLCWWD